MTTPPPDIVAAALRAAAHSPCRSKRGAAAFTHNGLIVAGFNHRPDGCAGSAKCKETCRTTAVHAEQDVILRSGPMRLHGAEMLHVKSVDGALVPSGGPSCPQCSKFILHANMAGVWLYHESGWRRYEAHEFHRLSLAALAAPVAAEPPSLTENTRLVELLRMAVAGDLCRGPACQHPDCVAASAALKECRADVVVPMAASDAGRLRDLHMLGRRILARPDKATELAAHIVRIAEEGGAPPASILREGVPDAEPPSLVAKAQRFVTLANTAWRDDTRDGRRAKELADAELSRLAGEIMAWTPAQAEPAAPEWKPRYNRETAHCTFNGGHHEDCCRAAFHHGMDTVFNLIESDSLLPTALPASSLAAPETP